MEWADVWRTRPGPRPTPASLARLKRVRQETPKRFSENSNDWSRPWSLKPSRLRSTRNSLESYSRSRRTYSRTHRSSDCSRPVPAVRAKCGCGFRTRAARSSNAASSPFGLGVGRLAVARFLRLRRASRPRCGCRWCCQRDREGPTPFRRKSRFSLGSPWCRGWNPSRSEPVRFMSGWWRGRSRPTPCRLPLSSLRRPIPGS